MKKWYTIIGLLLFGLAIILLKIDFEKLPYFKENEKGIISTFDIYSLDSNLNLKKETEIRISRKELTIEDGIEVILNTISEDEFENLEIKLHSIIDNNGEKIAIINLVDSKEVNLNWENNYFYSDSSIERTKKILIENILQKDRDGEWIDGVKFIYNGKEINKDNILPLDEIIYRKG